MQAYRRHMTTQAKIANKQKVNKKEGKILWSGGDENERLMENNVNWKDMRFVIRNRVDVDDVSPSTAPEFPFDVAWTTSVFPQRGRDDAAQLR